MATQGSITHWIDSLKAGDQGAAEHLWERYFDRLVELARKKLGTTNRRVADEEDVALSAFHSACLGLERGRFPRLDDRNSLWGLLVVIASRKAIDQEQYFQRQKRGGGNVVGESAIAAGVASQSHSGGISQIASQEPTPEFAIMMAEECERLLDRLGDETLRKIALWKMEGCKNGEIAERLSCAPRTVERKLKLIRDTWSHEGMT